MTTDIICWVRALDLLMAIDGFPTLADLRAGGAQRI
jgi:hypothetical protein